MKVGIRHGSCNNPPAEAGYLENGWRSSQPWIWPDGGPSDESSPTASSVMSGPTRFPLQRCAADRPPVRILVAVAITQPGAVIRHWMRLRTGAEQIPVSTAVEFGLVGREPSASVHRSQRRSGGVRLAGSPPSGWGGGSLLLPPSAGGARFRVPTTGRSWRTGRGFNIPARRLPGGVSDRNRTIPADSRGPGRCGPSGALFSS